MTADNLPRPASPGPLRLDPDELPLLKHADNIGHGPWTPVVVDANGVPVALFPGPRRARTPDARAFAALPDWIDAHDAAVAERDALARRMDAVRAECIEALVVLGPGADGRHELARLVLALLDGEA